MLTHGEKLAVKKAYEEGRCRILEGWFEDGVG